MNNTLKTTKEGIKSAIETIMKARALEIKVAVNKEAVREELDTLIAEYSRECMKKYDDMDCLDILFEMMKEMAESRAKVSDILKDEING